MMPKNNIKDLTMFAEVQNFLYYETEIVALEKVDTELLLLIS